MTKNKQSIIGGVLGLALSLPVVAITLEEVVNSTVQSNPEILASVNEHQAVSEEINQARGGYYPKVDVAIGTGFEKSRSPATRNPSRNTVRLNRDEASIRLNQMLFDGMQTRNEVRRQTARMDSRAYNVAGVSEDKALETVDAYLNVLRQQKLVDLASTNFEAHQRTHDQIKLRAEHGVTRRADLDQSNGRVALAKTNLIAERSNLLDAETNYLRVVGEAANNLSEVDSPRSMVPAELDEAIATALDNHPVLRSANADIESANAQHATANAPFYPKLNLELGATADNNIDGTSGTNKDLTAMLQFKYNLSNGGTDAARREETAYLINQATEIRNNTYRQVEQSMRLSWNALETVTNQMEYFEQHVQSSERSRDAYQQQFNLGQRTLLDLLDSENEVFIARQSYVNAQYDEKFAMYRILNSMGMLLPSLNISLPEARALAAN